MRNLTDAQLFDYGAKAYDVTCFDKTNQKLSFSIIDPIGTKTAEFRVLCPLQGLTRVRIMKER